MKTKRNNQLVVRIASRTRYLLLSQASGLRLLALSSLAVSSAVAQTTYYWDSNGTTNGFGNTTGTWGTSAFWGTSAAGTGATAASTITSSDTINFGTATLNYANATVGISGAVSVGSVVIGAGQTTALTLGTAGTANTMTIHSGITKNSGSAAVSIISPVALGGSQTWTNNSSSNLNVTGGVNNGGNTLTIDGSGRIDFSATANIITGTGGLTKNGTGYLALSGAGTTPGHNYSGKTTLNGGTILIQNGNNSTGTGNFEITNGVLEYYFGASWTRALGTGAGQAQITGGTSGFSGQGATGTTFNLGSSITWGSATFNPTEFVLQSATANSNGLGTFSSNINLNGADRTIRSDQGGGVGAGGSGTFSGAISNSTGTAGIIKTGVGHHIFSGTNTYNGNTSVNQGALTVTTIGALPGFSSAGRVSVASGATLIVRPGASWTAANIDALRGAATWSDNTSVLGLDTAGGSFSYSSNITQGISVTKFGGNNLTLSGASTYTGVTSVNGNGGVIVASIGNTGLTSSPLGVNNTAINFAGSSGELEYTGAGETSNRLINISGTAGTIRTGTNTGALVLSAAINPTSTANKTLTLLGTSTLANTISGNIGNGAGGTLSVTKNLSGTWVLSGTNTYSGGTSLSAGTLIAVGSSALGSGVITFNTSSTTLQFRNDANASYANTWTAGGQNINNTLVVDRVTGGSAVNLTFTQQYNRANGAVFNFQKGSNITSGTPTITFSGGFTNTDSTNATIGGTGGSGPNTFNPTGVNLVINGIAASSRTKAYIFQGNTDDNQITGTFANGTGTSIRKAGTGTWTLNGTSQYTGTTEVTAGTLKFGRQSALYSGSSSSWTASNISVQSGATLAFNVGGTNEFTTGNVTTLLTNLAASSSATNGMNAGSNLGFDTSNASGGTFTISNVIANTTGASGGNRGLTKLGTGTLVLTGTNTYDGATTVTAGTLVVNGDQSGSAGAVTVASGATLAGSGTVGGATTISGSHAPGNSPGTQTFSSDLTYSAGSTFNWEITTGTNTYDKVIVGGTLGGTGATFNIASSTTFDNSFWDTNKTWTDIFTTNGTTGIDYSGIFSSVTTTTPLLDRGSFSITGSTLTWTAVPEASNLLIGGLVGLGLMARRRKQQ